MKDIELMIDLENIVRQHQESLNRLIAYSVRGMLYPDSFTLELAKMQKQALKRCISLVPENDKERLLREIERLYLLYHA